MSVAAALSGRLRLAVAAVLLAGPAPIALGLALGGTLAASPARAVAQEAEKSITIDLQGADIVNVIRLIGDVSGKNIVVAEDVTGKVTVKLKNVGWRAALHVILKSAGAGVVEEGNILWVAPQARIDAMEQAELDKNSQQELKGALYTRIISVNNARASDLVALVKPMLSARGTVAFDDRTNVLIVRDVAGSSALRAVP